MADSISGAPLRRSALHNVLLGAGARMQAWRGWERAESVGDPTAERQAVRTGVVLADLSAQHILLAQGRQLEAWLPFAPPVGWVAAVSNGGSSTRCCRLTSDSALFLGADPIELPGSPSDCAHRRDLTSGRTIVAVAGPRSPTLLHAVTQVDLREQTMPDRRCVQSSVAEVPAMILRYDRRGVQAYEILIPREFGEYVWEVLRDAGLPLGVRAVGTTALESGD